eukprot:RCo051884
MDQHFKELFAQEKAKLEETRRAKAVGSKQTEEDAGNCSGAFPEEKRDATSGSPENGKSNDASAGSAEVTVGKDTIENATGSALRKEAYDADKKGCAQEEAVESKKVHKNARAGAVPQDEPDATCAPAENGRGGTLNEANRACGNVIP